MGSVLCVSKMLVYRVSLEEESWGAGMVTSKRWNCP